MRPFLTACAIVTALTPASALAWGGSGHKTIAAIAWSRMTPLARAEAQRLLAASDDGLVGAGFIESAVWADAYRDSSEIARRTSRRWHYVNFSYQAINYPAACPQDSSVHGRASTTGSDACGLTKLNVFLGELSDPTVSEQERGRALRFTIHLVGDLHQPLHAIDHEDGGGNCEEVLAPDGRKTSLHGYWDTSVVSELGRQPVQLARTLSAQIDPAKARRWAGEPTAGWVNESYVLARDVAYAYGGPNYCDHISAPVRITPAYDARARKVAAEQLQKAGVRLAAVLNFSLARGR
jgi:hypothetical protein